MSTAGKVLIVLCLLVAGCLVIVFSGVGELNKNWAQSVEDLKKRVADAEAGVAKNERDIVALKDQIALEQKAANEQLAVLRSRQSDAEGALSKMTERATRVRFQLAGIEAAVKNAEVSRALRIAEEKAERKAIDDAEHEVEELKEEHAGLVAQLDRLRAEFKETLESNRRLADRLSRAGNKPGS